MKKATPTKQRSSLT